MNVHCLFEQSGTFKNVFKELGFKAYDYDILNDFNETDYKIDLFTEIFLAYHKYGSIFDNIDKDDLVIAFFPCTYFTRQCYLHTACNAKQLQKLDDVAKIRHSLKIMEERDNYYSALCQLVLIAIERGFKLIIENPYQINHYLTLNFPIKPKVIDFNRRLSGDYFKKPTQYFFINCEPKNEINFDAVDIKPIKKCVSNCSIVERSIISYDYAYNFVRRYII